MHFSQPKTKISTGKRSEDATHLNAILQYLLASKGHYLIPFPLMFFVQTVNCCGIMGVVSTEHASGTDIGNDARHLLLEVRGKISRVRQLMSRL